MGFYLFEDGFLLFEGGVLEEGADFGVAGFEADLPVFWHLLALLEPGVDLVAIDEELKVWVHGWVIIIR